MANEHIPGKRFLSHNINSNTADLEFELLIYSIGYEARSRHIAQMYMGARRKFLAIYYDENQVLSYRENEKFSRKLGSTIIGSDTETIRNQLELIVSELRQEFGPVRVAVDVSSMNRTVMATVLLALYDLAAVSDAITMLYSPAKYHKPDLLLRPLTKMSPAHPSLSGVIGDPDLSRCVLLGLGYEYGLSLSILDTHEPDMAFIFKPTGFDKRFEASVQEANFGFDFGERNYEIIEYSLQDISYLFDTMTNLIYSAKHNTQFTAVPFGPKIFSAISILCAAIHYPHLSVLRYSLGELKDPVDVLADAHVVGCSLLRVADPLYK